MKIPQEKHIAFYEQQIKAHEDKWREYADSAMNILIQEKKLFVGRIWGIQQNQGNVVLRFNEGEVPRMKQPYFLGLVGNESHSDPMNWTYSYKTFRESTFPRYFSGVKADIYTLTFWKTEDKKSYILISGFDLEVLSEIKEKYLDNSLHPLIIVAETDPPVKYLINLKDFISKNISNEILNLDVDVSEKIWNPQNLDNSNEITPLVLSLIENQKATTIQGPPGTGKSYLAAELCDFYLKQSKSVCVTSLTNKALMEIASKPGLSDQIQNSTVFKTNLSGEELKALPKIQIAESLTPNKGQLLLSTYYKLAQKYNDLIAGSQRFDVIIIEEASQAYLATIAMFSSIALKVLIIGDHKQLTPIALNIEEAKMIFPKINGAINGLQTYAFNNNDFSFRLIKTRRLTSDAALLTGLYYNNYLESISDIEGKTGIVSKFRNLFHKNGGTTIVYLPSSRSGFSEKDVFLFICLMAREILENNSDVELALLTPYADVESDLYTQYSTLSNDYKNLTINTIHKIQGLTADLTIVYLPLTTAFFDLNDNLFNVATSRAKRGTLIITYNHINLISSVSNETMQYIKNCKDVSDKFLEIFKLIN